MSSLSESTESTNLEKPLGGRYKIISQLGAGGFGHTFLAEDIHLKSRRCVVKQLKPKTTDTESLKIASRLFETEADVLERLGIHDQIPELLAHFEDNQEFYLVQELIEGEPLSREIVSGVPWSEPQVISLLEDLLQVLTFVHEQNVIHRDIKPSNLIRRLGDRKIVLIDFGAVKQVSVQMANPQLGQATSTICIGTGGYMPNEQVAGHPRFSSDLYALGVVAIQALTGLSPKHLSIDFQTSEIDWHDHAPHVSRKLATFIDRLVRYDFRDRYETAAEALEALRNLANISIDPLPSSRHTDSFDAQASVNTQQEAQDLPKSVPQESPPHSTKRQSLTQKQLQTHRQPFNTASTFAVLASVLVTFVVTKTFFPTVIQNTIEKTIEKTIYKIIRPSTQNSAGSPANPSPSPSNSPRAKSNSPSSKVSVQELLSKADQLRNNGKYEEALDTYDQAIARDPNKAEAYWGRCYSLNKLQLPSAAITACDRALALKPNYPEALSSKGYALDQQNKHKKALESSEEAIKTEPKFAEAWSNRGAALLDLNRPSEALAAFEKATALRPDYDEAWTNRAAALWRLKRYDEAIAALDKAIDIDPKNKNAQNLREQARKQLGR